MLEKLMNNPYAWLISSLITVFSFAFGIYTWITGKKIKEISVSNLSHVIIKAGKSQIPKLDVVYDGVNIDNLTVTQFYIWNSGNDVIDSSDVVESKKLSIYGTEDTCILDAQILKVVEQSNEISIANMDPGQVIIEFEYLDQGEGCLIQLLHTGSAEELYCDCKIKGGKKVRYCYDNSKKPVSAVSKVISTFITVLEAISVVLGILIVTMIFNAIGLHIKHWIYVLITCLICFFIGFSSPFIFKFIQNKYNKAFHRTVPSVLKGKT